MTVLAAFGRADVANYLGALLWVYTLLIIAYVVVSVIFSIGVRIPYARWTDGLLTFLREVCEPYLSLFRRFIPPLGPIDITPIVAIVVLQIVGQVIVSLVQG